MSSQTALTPDEVLDVGGEPTVGRTISLKLSDDRVLVARVTQLQDGDVHCPVDDCIRRFDSERGLKTHLGKQHPDVATRTRTCPGCDEEFEPSYKDNRYCSRDCYFEHKTEGSVTKICPNCDEPFSISASKADDRKHCSKECQLENPDWPPDDAYERENSRVERACEECGDSFEVYPSEDQKFCSVDCYSASRWDTAICEMCGVEFEKRKTGRSQQFCSRYCYYEDCRNDPLPDGAQDLVDELLEEDHTLESLHARALAHLRGEHRDLAVAIRVARATTDHYLEAVDVVLELVDDIDQDEVLDELLRQLVDDLEFPSYVDAGDVEVALDASSTYYELSEELRTNRDRVRKLVNELGLKDRFSGSYQQRDLLDDVREKLDIDLEDESPEEQPRWKQLQAAHGGGG